MDLRVSVLKIMTLIMLQLWVFVPASTASSHLVRHLRFYQTYKEPVKTSVSVKKVFSPYPQANALSNHCTVAWVTRPDRPKGVKDEVKWTRRAPRLLYWHTFDGDTLQVFWRKTLPLNYDQLTERHWKGSWLIWFWTNMITWSGECWEISDVWTREQTFGETFLQESRTDLAVHARSTLSSNIYALNVLQKVTIFRCNSSS